MQRFFFDDETLIDDKFEVCNEKYNHIVKVLRMNVGEKAVFCDGNYTDYICELTEISQKSVSFCVIEKYRNPTEPDIQITVFQCLPKGDKFDEMVKRSVQYGAYKIVPVISSRCVSRPDAKSATKKVERLNKIARSSAMQSMRGVIPKVCEPVAFDKAIEMMKEYDSAFICYEDEKKRLPNHDVLKGKEIAFLVGPEGGLDASEIECAEENGILSVSLGRRILRTEDAATFLIPIILFSTDNL